MGRWDTSSDEDNDNSPKSRNKASKKAKIANNFPESSTGTENKGSSTAVSVGAIDDEKEAARATSAELEIKPSLVANADLSAIGIEIQTEEQAQSIKPSVAARAHNSIFDGCRSVDSYQRLDFIDQGTYGMVFKARCRDTGVVYALKQVKFGPETNKVGFPITALREINILLALKHPNIVKVKEMVVGSSIDKIFMVMEYCENDLKTVMKQAKQCFSTAEIKQLMLQLLGAINHMHEHWYIHRDLKTSNLLYSNKGYLAVCDFGLARKYGSPLVPYTYEVVTLWYRCPALLLGERLYSTPLDMWSIGCIFAEIMSGQPLFPGEGEIDQITKIFKILGAPNEDRWPGFSKLPNVSKISWRVPTKSKLRELFPLASFSGGLCLSDRGFDLLSKLLNMDPLQRISAAEALSHPWFEEIPKPTPADKMPRFDSRS